MNLFITTLLLAAGAVSMARAAPTDLIEGQGASDASGADSLAVVQSDSTAAVGHPSEAPSAHRVIAYYFHGEFRCENCLRIEAGLNRQFAPSSPRSWKIPFSSGRR